MKFCIECGTDSVTHKIPLGDNRHRFICSTCQYIHYVNPRMICGTLPIHDDKVLLCKRDIEPQKGLWTLPAGFMENGETIEAAAARETFEEAMAISENSELYCIFSLPHINQVHIFYRCSIKDGHFGAGSETQDAALFSMDDIPWDQLAFKTVIRCLQRYQNDRKLQTFPVRAEDIIPISAESESA